MARLGASETRAGVEPLGRNRDFRVVLGTEAISALGDAVTSLALPLLVLAVTGSGSAIAAVGAITALADLLFATPAGVLADRGDRKRLMIGADLGRALLTALVPLSVLAGWPTLAVVVLVTAPMSVLRAVFRAASIAAIPDLVGRPNLARANALLETVASTAFIVGPSIAGLLATAIGPAAALAIDALSYAVSAGGLLLVRRALRAPTRSSRPGMLAEIREGMAFVAHHRVLRAAILLFSLYTASTVGLTAALVVRVTRDLAEPAVVLSTLVTAIAVGALAGALAAPRVVTHAGFGRTLVGCVAVNGGCLIALAGLDWVRVMLAPAALFGATEGVLMVSYVTLRSAQSPDELLGRIGSTARTVSLGLQPVGFLLCGILLATAGAAITMVAMAAALCLIAGVFALVRPFKEHADPNPRLREEPRA